jgi:fatty-acyl-CoA synthase
MRMAAIQPDMLNLGPRPGDAGGAAVPRQWLVAWPFPPDDRRQAGHARRASMDGESIYELLDTEKVTITAAVPTIWLMLLQYLEKHGGKKLPDFTRGDRRLGLPARHHQGFRGRITA